MYHEVYSFKWWLDVLPALSFLLLTVFFLISSVFFLYGLYKYGISTGLDNWLDKLKVYRVISYAFNICFVVLMILIITRVIVEMYRL